MVFGCAPRWNTLYGGSSLTEDTLGRHGRAAHPHTKLPAQEAQYFEQALAPLSDLHGSQAHIGDQHVAGPELVETVLNTFSHLFPPGTGELLA